MSSTSFPILYSDDYISKDLLLSQFRKLDHWSDVYQHCPPSYIQAFSFLSPRGSYKNVKKTKTAY
ncbi:predicted protein [Histoplasma mississippiense (nom. inval.)]|uniref:predicted protein n=1 Tax=Ajellomyces capsulatus (strain NAm1 / WU24) TaxID=2059318 RepID=UPI000157D2EA|nr:predicted protein [Histoplasma mississippiense (nom. inval.)]EDN04645.1 predicted protein [Histoplasma mississippiense (nom. inval.)]